MPPLKDLKEDRFAVARAHLKLSNADALRWAGYDVDEWTDGGIRAYGSKQANKDRIKRRMAELVADLSQEDSLNPSLVTGEMLLAKASSMVLQSQKASDFKASTELYLKLRKDLERELDARAPAKGSAQVGSAEHSRRLNAAVQARLARLGGRLESGESSIEQVDAEGVA